MKFRAGLMKGAGLPKIGRVVAEVPQDRSLASLDDIQQGDA